MTTTKDFLAACEVIDGLRAQLATVTRERDEANVALGTVARDLNDACAENDRLRAALQQAATIVEETDVDEAIRTRNDRWARHKEERRLRGEAEAERDRLRAALAKAIEEREALRAETRALTERLLSASGSIIAREAERDEARAALERAGEDLDASVGHGDRLAAVLEDTPENVEAVAADLLRVYNETPTKEDPAPEASPPWQEVVDEGSADDWRAFARGFLAALRARVSQQAHGAAAQAEQHHQEPAGEHQPTNLGGLAVAAEHVDQQAHEGHQGGNQGDHADPDGSGPEGGKGHG